MKILLECFAEDVTETKHPGSEYLPSAESVMRVASSAGSVSSGLDTSCSRHASA